MFLIVTSAVIHSSQETDQFYLLLLPIIREMYPAEIFQVYLVETILIQQAQDQTTQVMFQGVLHLQDIILGKTPMHLIIQARDRMYIQVAIRSLEIYQGIIHTRETYPVAIPEMYLVTIQD